MKKNLLLILFSFCTILYMNAQPVIELTGNGVAGQSGYTLLFEDLNTIDKIVVEAKAAFREGVLPSSVTFSDLDETYHEDFILAEHDYAPTIPNGTDQNWGYYTATFNSIDAGGITLDKMGQDNEIISYIAYVYRNYNDPGKYSDVIYEHAFVFRNGAEHPFTYEFDLAATSASRDLVVQVPLSDIASGYTPRYAVVTLKAGDNTITEKYSENNMGDFLHIAKLEMENVPGNITKVYLSVYSPTLDEDYGDSFLTGGALLSVNEKWGCTLTQGYWKTHSEYGPAKKADPTWELLGPDTEFFLSGKSYIKVLNTAPAGNAYYILAHQYIAAELNFLSGAGNTEVLDEFEDATELLNSNTPEFIGNLKGNNVLRNNFIELADILDNYNNGLIGPGHCDAPDVPEVASITGSFHAEVNPNPVKNNAQVKFVPLMDGKITLELFDIMGNKKESLIETNVLQDVPVQLSLNAKPYKEGSYVLVITNGNIRESLKLKIIK